MLDEIEFNALSLKHT